MLSLLSRCLGSSLLLPILLVAGSVSFPGGDAGAYPTNLCVSQKMSSAASYCHRVLRAWSSWETSQNDTRRDSQLLGAEATLAKGWGRAETRSASSGVDCVDTTASYGAVQSSVDTVADEIVLEVNGGLDLGDPAQARCGKGLLRAAAAYCSSLVRAESRFVKSPARDPRALTRDRLRSNARDRFARTWDRAAGDSCTSGADESDVAGRLEDLAAGIVADTTVSPNVPDSGFMAVTHPTPGQPGHALMYEGTLLTPQCQDSSAYSFFAKRGTVNKLLVYYVGGGACWDDFTCAGPLGPRCTQDVDLGDWGGLIGASTLGSGFGDLTNPANPFADWNIVVIPYCSCDVHWGDAAVDYFPSGKHVEHRGHDNARLVEKWTREHFVNPDEIFMSGSSAGAYGATLGAVFLSAVYPASQVNMMADAGNGVITQEFLDESFGNWGAEENLPDIPGIGDVPIGEQSIPTLVTSAARAFPRTRWAHYTAAFDGGLGGQTGFFNIMLNPDNIFAWLPWWNASCLFNETMLDQARETQANVSLEADNYRYYVASGSRHTGWGLDRVYTDTTGGVPTLVDWVNAMRAGGVNWISVEANPMNVLFSGDPRPSPLEPPFTTSGGDVVIDCGP